MIYETQRDAVCEYAIRMWRAGLVVGSAGNISVRAPSTAPHFVITPSSIPYQDLTPELIMVVDEDGDLLELDDEPLEHAPSFETPMHLAVYAARPDVGAVVHTHSKWASARAVAGAPIPPIVDEMVVYFGGPVEVAAYAPSGSDELAENVSAALGPRSGVLLGSHGVLTTGKDLKRAYKNAELIEHIAQIVTVATQIHGGPIEPLPDEVLEAQRGMYEVIKGM